MNFWNFIITVKFHYCILYMGNNLRADFAEYTECKSCQQALMYCECNCPYCGNREECECELGPLVLGK